MAYGCDFNDGATLRIMLGLPAAGAADRAGMLSMMLSAPLKHGTQGRMEAIESLEKWTTALENALERGFQDSGGVHPATEEPVIVGDRMVQNSTYIVGAGDDAIDAVLQEFFVENSTYIIQVRREPDLPGPGLPNMYE